MIVYRAITEPIRVNQKWEDLWAQDDKGLIACWERGREKCKEDPQLAINACNDELVVLPWKGGVEKAIKLTHKYGSLKYLAMWQGIRGENLSIAILEEKTLICSKTKMTVTFTNDQTKFSDALEGM